MLQADNEGPRRRISVTVRDGDDAEVSSKEPEPASASPSSMKHYNGSSSSKTLHPGRWMTSIIALLLLFVSVYLLWNNYHEGIQASEPLQVGDSPKSMAIILHPEEHSIREPTNITLDWTITSGLRSPDGVKKRVYLVNGLFPGPTIEVRAGDELTVHVHNGLENEGVAIHWHGIRLPNEMDGAVGFTQCPISPGESFTYRIQLGEQHGTFWWHAHFQSQRGDGLYGGLVIHEPKGSGTAESSPQLDYEKDVLLMVGDWFHRPADAVLDWYMDPGHFGNEPVPDSLLINGLGRFDCAMAVAGRPVECAAIAEDAFMLMVSGYGRARLRLINVGTIAGFSVSVEGASLQAITVDGSSPIVAQTASSIGILYPGERVDAILRWIDGSIGSSVLNVELDPENFKYPNPSLNSSQSFTIGLVGSAGPIETEVTQQPLAHQDLTVANATVLPDGLMPVLADHTILLYVKTQKLARYSNQPRGFINHTSWKPQSPPLLSVARSAWNKNQLVPYVPKVNETSSDSDLLSGWVDIVINNLDDGAHPFHLHGHSFYVLSSYLAEGTGGWGSWNPYAQKPAPGGLNLETPLLKDTVSVPRRGHVVLRFRPEAQGVWMLHCHMLVHLGSGMAVGVHVGSQGDEAHVVDLIDQSDSLCKT